MKSRRIGTISMAIVLIGFGILIFVAQINRLSAVELSIKFWPSILILLGGEILWFSFKEKKENDNIVIRYDVLSIFIVMAILFFNIAIYGLVETGIMDYIRVRVAEETVKYERHLE